MPQSIRSGSSFDSLIPALTDNADIVKALKDYHYGTISHPSTQGQENALTTGLVGIFNTKANLAGPTFTGNVVLPSTTSIGNISATELGYLDGVTSAIQTQIGNKANSLDPTFTGTATIPTIISNTINATSATGNTASLYPNITTGTMAIGAGLTTGTLNIASATAGAKTINIGTSTGTVNFNSSINTAGIVRPNATSSAGSISLTAGSNTSNGSGGSVSITAGSYTASGSAGNVSINAGGGPSNGTVSIQGAQGNTGDIYLGNFGSTTAVGGDFAVGGNIGVDGLFVDFYGNVTTGGTISSTGTITVDANITSSGKSSGPTESNVGYHLNQAGYIIATRNNGTPMYSSVTGASGLEVMMQFLYNGSENGRIRVDSGALPAFATASDYRVKTDITPITNAIERMKNAKAYTFHKINEVDPSNNLHTGFIAHELALVQPDAVVGEKNAVDAVGNPIYQEVMEAKLIPVMAQAINDLIGMVEKLSTEIEQLKN